MFWGITLESGKKYTQVLQRSFMVTMAALGFENPSNDTVYVVAEVSNEHQQQQQHVLCSLQAGKVPQQTLNLKFTEGEHVSFFIEGQGQVHLTGYLTLDDTDDSDSDSADESDHENEIVGGNGLQNPVGNQVSDISWQGILSGSRDNGLRNNSQLPVNNLGMPTNEEDSDNDSVTHEYNNFVPAAAANLQEDVCDVNDDGEDEEKQELFCEDDNSRSSILEEDDENMASDVNCEVIENEESEGCETKITSDVLDDTCEKPSTTKRKIHTELKPETCKISKGNVESKPAQRKSRVKVDGSKNTESSTTSTNLVKKGPGRTRKQSALGKS